MSEQAQKPFWPEGVIGHRLGEETDEWKAEHCRQRDRVASARSKMPPIPFRAGSAQCEYLERLWLTGEDSTERDRAVEPFLLEASWVRMNYDEQIMVLRFLEALRWSATNHGFLDKT